MADPLTQFFAWVGSTIAANTTVGAFMIMYAEQLAYATLIAGSISIGKEQQRRAEARARDQYNSQLQDHTLTVTTGTYPSPFLVGRIRVGGVLVHAQTTGTLGEYLHLVVAHAMHECDAIETVYLNDKLLPAENPSTGMVESGDFVLSEAAFITETLTADGSGVITLSNVAIGLVDVVPAGAVSYERWYSTIAVTFSGPSNTVSGLTPGLQVKINYKYNKTTPLVRVRKHLGQAGQTADADLIAELGGEWTASDKGTNVCYTYVRLLYHPNVFGSMGLPIPSAVIRGSKHYDPRTSTTIWTKNPQIIAASYLRNTQFGLRSSLTEVPHAEQIAYANICDEEVPIFNSGTCGTTAGTPYVTIAWSNWQQKVRPGMIFVGPNSVRYEIAEVQEPSPGSWRIRLVSNYPATVGAGTYSIVQARYECNGALGSDNSVLTNLNDVLASMAGYAVFIQGRWMIRPGYYPTPALTIDEAKLGNSSIKINPHRGRQATFNGVSGQFFDRFRNWIKVDYPPITSSVYETEDGGERILANLSYQLVDSAAQCQRLAKISLLQSRQDLIIELSTNLKAYDLVPGSVILLNLSAFGFSNKPFRVLSREYGFGVQVKYICQETSATIYDWAFNEVLGQDFAPNTSLPDPTKVPTAPTGLTAASGNAHALVANDGSTIIRVLVTWTASADIFVRSGGYAEIEWKPSASDTWIRVGRAMGDDSSMYISGVPDNIPINVRARFVVGGTGKYSDWSVISHSVTGWTDAPPSVSGFAADPGLGSILVRWSAATFAGYDYTEVRAGASWAAGTVVFSGRASGFPYAQTQPASTTFFAKHVNTSGIESAAAVTVTATSLRAESVLNYDFTNGSDGWSNIASVGSGDSGASGGTYGLHVGTAGVPAFPRFVSIDTSRRYRVTGRVWTSAGSGGPIYIGVLTKDAGGNILGNVGGPTYAYCAASNFAMTGGWHTFSGEISGTQAIPSATIDPSKFFAGSVSAAPMAFPNTGYTGQFIIDYLVLEDITDAGMAAAQGFAIHRMWDFNSVTLEGWSLTGLSVSYSTKTAILITATTTDPQLVISGLSIPGATFDKIRMRVKRVVGTGWQGDLYYETTGGHSYSDTYKLTIPADNQPSNSDWQILEWDLAKHGNAGAQSDWPASDIFSLRFDLSQGAVGDSFLIDWIAIGKVGEAFDPASVTNAQWVGRGVSVQGDVAVKSRPTTAWDSDVYSREQFYGGAVASASFNVEQGGLVMFGLNSDPLTDASYTSLDYAWYFEGSSARMRIFESGVDLGVIDTSPASTDVYTVAYDGSKVIYMKNGSVMRSAAAAHGLSLFFDSSFNSANVGLRGMRFGAMSSNNWQSVGGWAKPSDYASADLTMVNDGNCVQSGNRVTKTAGGNGWTGGMHTRNAYTAGAYISCYMTTGMAAMAAAFAFGLNDTQTTTDENDINFCFRIGIGTANNVDVMIEGTVTVAGATTWADGDHFEITYDGYKAHWYKNGALLHSASVTNTNPLFGDCAIWRQDTYVDRISFGPMSRVAELQTEQITPGATYGGGANNYSVSGGTIAAGATSYSSGAQALGSFDAAGQARIVEQAVFTMTLIFGAAVVSYVEVQLGVTRDDGVGTIHSIVGYFPCVPASSGSKCNLVLPGLYRDVSVPAAGTKNYTVSLTVYFFNSTGSAIAAGLGASITWSMRNVSNEFKV